MVTVSRSCRSRTRCSRRFWIGLPGWMTVPGPPISCSTRAGLSCSTLSSTSPMSESRNGPGTPQIVTRRHGPWASARREQRDAVLRRPGEPVEEALVAGALLGDREPAQALGAARVVGAHVEEAVGLRSEVVRSGVACAMSCAAMRRSFGERPRGAHERPDLVAQHRRRVGEERGERRVGGGQLAHRLAQRLERARSSGAKPCTSVSARSVALQEPGQPRDRRRDVLSSARERVEDRVRGADQPARSSGRRRSSVSSRP